MPAEPAPAAEDRRRARNHLAMTVAMALTAYAVAFNWVQGQRSWWIPVVFIACLVVAVLQLRHWWALRRELAGPGA